MRIFTASLNIIMRVVGGYYHPVHGFKAMDFIDSVHADQWLECASLDLIASAGFIWDGVPVPSSELTPILTYDASMDRLLNRYAGARCVPERKP